MKKMEKPTKKVSNLIDLRQSGVIAMIASGMTIAQVSRETGLSQKHLYSLCSKSNDLLNDAVSAAHNKIRARLPNLVTMAMDIIESQMERGSPDTRRRAARVLLNVAARLSPPQCDICAHKIIDNQ